MIPINRYTVGGVLLVALLGVTYFKGFVHGRQKYDELVARLAVEETRIAQAREKVTTRVVVKYVEKQGQTQAAQDVIKREVIRYANSGMCLDRDWRVLHDAAARNDRPSESTDAAPTAASALATVTGNYRAHHECADRLEALQEWVKGIAVIK